MTALLAYTIGGRKPMTAMELRTVAHHEAGHALAIMELCPGEIDTVRIGVHMSRGTLAEGDVTMVKKTTSLRVLSFDEVWNFMVVKMAGPCAEFRDGRYRRYHASEATDFFETGPGRDDWKTASAMADGAAFIKLGLPFPANGTKSIEFPLAVRELSQEIMEQTFEQAQKFVDQHWTEIRALAIELQKRGTMTGDEIWEFLTRRAA
jgi:hypothetical protein